MQPSQRAPAGVEVHAPPDGSYVAGGAVSPVLLRHRKAVVVPVCHISLLTGV
jgi:hypothetical protein